MDLEYAWKMPVDRSSLSDSLVRDIPMVPVSSLQENIAIAVNAIAVTNFSFMNVITLLFLFYFRFIRIDLIVECLIFICKILMIAKYRNVFTLGIVKKFFINHLVGLDNTIAIVDGEFPELEEVEVVVIVLQQLLTGITEFQTFLEIITEVLVQVLVEKR